MKVFGERLAQLLGGHSSLRTDRRATCPSRAANSQDWRSTMLAMVREPCSRSASPRKYGRSSTTKGFSTTSLMRIMALLGDRLGDSLYTNREKIEISQVFIEI